MDAIAFRDATRWEAWLADHLEAAADVWLKIAKKGSGRVSVTITEALDVALCYGWIDSQRKSHDDEYYLQRYSPRRAGSPWSRVNIDKASALIEAGRMRAPGFAVIALAKADGRWEAAYESQRNATVPPDLAAALEGNPRAAAHFELLGKTDRYAVILQLLKAKSPKPRAARLEKAVAALDAGAQRDVRIPRVTAPLSDHAGSRWGHATQDHRRARRPDVRDLRPASPDHSHPSGNMISSPLRTCYPVSV